MSLRRTGRAGGRLLVAAAALVSPLLLRGALRGSGGLGFAAPSAGSRRAAALSALLPLAAPAAAVTSGPGAALAKETARISRSSGGAKLFSFSAPPGMAFEQWKVEEDKKDGSTSWSKKDGGLIVAGKFPPGAMQELVTEATAPTLRGPPGVKLVKYQKGVAQDDLEFAAYAISPASAADGPFTNVYGGADRKTGQHYWMRNVRAKGKEATILIILPQDQMQSDQANMEAILDSFRVEA